MSLTNFTPGPWHIGAPHDREGSVTTISKAHEHFSTPIADVINTHKQDGKANLRLLAAAPDLYAALDAFLDAFEETGEVDFAIRQKARAALNRAEGRTP